MRARIAKHAVKDVPRRLRRTVARRRRALDVPCLAPYANLYLGPQGDVRACCVNANHLGNIKVQRLPEIWGGFQQRELRARLDRGDFSYGCGYCGWEQDREIDVYSHVYDGLQPPSPVPDHPTRIEFALSNACNLQCVMCNGENSSAIRIHREGRPPSPPAYGEQFFEDLDDFLPHLDEASFVGGEPFLVAENFRVWERLAEVNPDVRCGVTTNATRWTPRIERVLDTLRMNVTVSIDGVTKETFEAVRCGADRDEVYENLRRFRARADRRGTQVHISHCLVPLNHHELADLLVFGEEHDIPVHVNVVSTPPEHCLEQLETAELEGVLASFRAQAERSWEKLGRVNRGTLLAQIARIEHALTEDEERRRPTPPPEHILGFPRRREHPPATAGEQVGAGGVVSVGPNSIILDCSPDVADALGIRREELIGLEVSHLRAVLERRFGELASEDEVPRGDDALERVLVFERGRVQLVESARRGDDGWADEAQVLVTVDD